MHRPITFSLVKQVTLSQCCTVWSQFYWCKLHCQNNAASDHSFTLYV